MPKFASGVQEAETRSASKGKFPKTHFFGIEDGEQVILRFLSDIEFNDQYPWVNSFITVDQHQMVPTKPQPQDFPKGRNWPSRMGTVCRHTKLASGDSLFPDCWVCDGMRKADGKPYKPSPRTWAVACLREEVIENGVRIGYKDATREVKAVPQEGKPTEASTTERALVIVNMAWSNFFSTLSAQASMYRTGTVMDRDYIVQRKGAGLDTEYHFVGCDIIPGMDARLPHVFGRYCGVEADALAKWKADPSTFNPATDAKLLQLPFDLEAEIDRRSSDDFYARWFDPNKTVTWSDGDGSGGSSGGGASVASSESPETKAKLEAMASRVKSYGGASPEPEVDAADPVATPQVADLG